MPGTSLPANASRTFRSRPEMKTTLRYLSLNAKAIWQDLVDSHGFTVGYQSVQRFVGKLRRTAKPEARAVIQTAPGEEAQVDYGSGPTVRDPQSGKYRGTRLFVLTLGYSRIAGVLISFLTSALVGVLYR